MMWIASALMGLGLYWLVGGGLLVLFALYQFVRLPFDLAPLRHLDDE